MLDEAPQSIRELHPFLLSDFPKALDERLPMAAARTWQQSPAIEPIG